jgi:hypothetical protein
VGSVRKTAQVCNDRNRNIGAREQCPCSIKATFDHNFSQKPYGANLQAVFDRARHHGGMELHGSRVLVTGGTSGIGRELVRQF